MKHICYSKLADHRGAKRVWLEGRRLADAGFVPGVRYRLGLDHVARAITLELTDGKHVVSRKRVGEREIPVVDICSRDLAALFGDQVERLRVEISERCIRLTVHPDEAAVIERTERLLAKLRAGEPLAVGSIAHGGGILDHAMHEGLARAGIASRLAFAIEIEKDYLECSLANNPVWGKGSMSIEGPMQEVETEILPRVELLNAGLPCTGASLAGRAKNGLKFAEQHETAGALFLAFLNIVKATRPLVISLENVPPYKNTVSYHVVTDVLSRWGYEVHDTVLDGNALGAVEDRKRLCMVAVSKGIPFDFAGLVAVREKEKSLGDVLEDIPAESEMYRDYRYLADKEARDVAAGKGFRRQLLTRASVRCGTIGRGYHKSRLTEPFVCHPSGDGRSRLLTPIEHARVKTVPEWLVAGVSNTTAHEILGQSVIWAAFVAVGRLLGESLTRLLPPAVAVPPAAASPMQASLFGEVAA
jgi:DNA (cytosine-5)-methyltransferase 1